MRRKRQDFARRLVTAFVAVLVAVSSTFILSKTTVKDSGDKYLDKNQIAYSVTSSEKFTDFHIRFSAPNLQPGDFKAGQQPIGWDEPEIKKVGSDIVVTWKDKDGKNGVKIGETEEFFLGMPDKDKVRIHGNTEWEVTRDKGEGTPFDDFKDGVIDKEQDKKLNHLWVSPLSGPESPIDFGIGLNGGWSSWSPGDFVLSKKYFDNLNSIPGYSASTNDLNGSPFGGIDLILVYNFSKNHAVGLSAGLKYFPGGMFEQKWTYQDTTSTSKLDLSAFVIPVELFYKLPVGKDFFLKLAGGVDFYHATIDYDSGFGMLGEEYFYRGKLKDNDIGSHVFLGVEYSLNKNLALSVDAGYHFAKPNNFTGTLVDRDGTGTDMRLTMAKDEFGEMISIYPTAEPLPPDYRPAEIDLKGLEIGLKITFIFEVKKTKN